MPRPFKNRMINSQPGCVVYKPAGIPARELEWITLSLDEFEAIRLIDHDGLDQTAAAEKMGVSRPTVTRIYARARKTIADTLVNGQALRIEGGPVIESTPMMGTGGRGLGRGRKHYNRGGKWNLTQENKR